MLSELRQQWETIRTVIARSTTLEQCRRFVDVSSVPVRRRRDATDKLQQTLEWSSAAAFMPPNSTNHEMHHLYLYSL